MQHWYCKEKLDASHSSCVINWLMGKLNPMWVSINFYFPLKTHCIKNTFGSLSPTPSCLIWQGTETFIGLFQVPSPSPLPTNTSPSLVIHQHALYFFPKGFSYCNPWCSGGTNCQTGNCLWQIPVWKDWFL